MRRQLTNATMLHAAELALAAHRATRPMTSSEALAQAAPLRAREASLRVGRLALLDRGDHPPDRLVPGRATWGADHVHAALETLDAAGRAGAEAASHEAIATDPAAAWRETERVLVARVNHYASLGAAR